MGEITKINRSAVAYIIRAISPLHVGAGDSHYGVIDKLVQRDSLTNYPIIHASSMKGALREYFEYWLPSKYEAAEADKKIKLIFGQGTLKAEEKEKKEAFAAGLFDFDLGFLLSLPVRCDKAGWVSATTVGILESMLERLELFGIEKAHKVASETLKPLLDLAKSQGSTPLVFNDALEGATLEDRDFRAKYLEIKNLEAVQTLLGKNPALLPADQFAELVGNLPVIARNSLENGQSTTLWYEEIVPRESRFYTTISRANWKNGGNSMEGLDDLFDQTLLEKRIQLGANATVGYGKTVFTKL